jgi:S1-C subfamily serine protease
MTASSPLRRATVAFVAILVAAAAALIVQLSGGGGRPGTAFSAAAAPPATGFERIVARALPSVVQIRSSIGLGSGVVFDRSGHVVTNAHVVAGSSTFRVTLADGSQHSATLVGRDSAGDLAVVQLNGVRPAPATFGDSSQVRVGEYALAIGNPLGLRSSVTQGVISSTSRTVGEGNGVVLPSAIQTSAPINPGNSGGALIDGSGEVIGIPTLAALDPEFGNTTADGIGFAISSNTVRSAAARLISHGRPGVALGLDVRGVPGTGVLVASASGPAARAGIRSGDVVARADGRAIHSVDDLAAVLATCRPGRAVALDLARQGALRRVDVTA